VLKQRVITALIVAVFLLGAIFYLPYPYFAGFISLIVLLAAWEWARLAGYNQSGAVVFVVVIALLMGVTLWWLDLFGTARFFAANKILLLCIVATLWWASVIYWVAVYPDNKIWAHKLIIDLIGVLVLLATGIGLIYLRGESNGDWLLVIMIVAVVCADTGAYFVGRKWGKRKLAPRVSPGKSWEGFFGGSACSFLFAVLLIVGLGFQMANLWLLVIVVCTSLISVYGDLMESLLKRERGVKDSGKILPGHGGVLDRADSILAAVPVFTLLYLLSGWRL